MSPPPGPSAQKPSSFPACSRSPCVQPCTAPVRFAVPPHPLLALPKPDGSCPFLARIIPSCPQHAPLPAPQSQSALVQAPAGPCTSLLLCIPCFICLLPSLRLHDAPCALCAGRPGPWRARRRQPGAAGWAACSRGVARWTTLRLPWAWSNEPHGPVHSLSGGVTAVCARMLARGEGTHAASCPQCLPASWSSCLPYSLSACLSEGCARRCAVGQGHGSRGISAAQST